VVEIKLATHFASLKTSKHHIIIHSRQTNKNLYNILIITYIQNYKHENCIFLADATRGGEKYMRFKQTFD
jgi:hypothetical protein